MTKTEFVIKEKQAGDHIPLKPETLKKKRLKGDGPIHVKIGRNIFYSAESLITWFEANKVGGKA
mgnify:CR=1 FL=1